MRSAQQADCSDNGLTARNRILQRDPTPAINATRGCPDDGLYCNGEEFCNEDADACGRRDAPDCPNDGLYCNGVEFCDEGCDACERRDAPDCPDDGLYCNGVEFATRMPTPAIDRTPRIVRTTAYTATVRSFCDETWMPVGYAMRRNVRMTVCIATARILRRG
jgi:hypothetical protein